MSSIAAGAPLFLIEFSLVDIGMCRNDDGLVNADRELLRVPQQRIGHQLLPFLSDHFRLLLPGLICRSLNEMPPSVMRRGFFSHSVGYGT